MTQQIRSITSQGCCFGKRTLRSATLSCFKSLTTRNCSCVSVMTDELHYRALQYNDISQLRLAHYDLFPIDYEDRFFDLACGKHSSIYSVAAFALDSEKQPTKLVGFAIGRSLQISQIDPAERSRLGISSSQWGSLYAAYILTLGVIKDYQKQGVATELISRFETESEKRLVKILYLHVITYNENAIMLYQKCRYECAALIRNFYSIKSGRQQDPRRTLWDAFLFVKYFDIDEDLMRLLTNQEQSKNCLSWNSCWPFTMRSWVTNWLSDVESTISTSCPGRGIGLPEGSSLFHRLFYRHHK